MDRLTRKGIKKTYIFSRANGKQQMAMKEFIDNAIYNKLSYLEDLEGELGCPIDVIFKAILNGIYDKDNEFYTVDKLEYSPNNCITYWYLSDSKNKMCFPVMGYKKTWWLKEDGSE